jgi:hypothetical protein
MPIVLKEDTYNTRDEAVLKAPKKERSLQHKVYRQ